MCDNFRQSPQYRTSRLTVIPKIPYTRLYSFTETYQNTDDIESKERFLYILSGHSIKNKKKNQPK